MLWFAVGNIAEHSGYTTNRNAADMWPVDLGDGQRGGWTYQGITGAFGTLLYEGESEDAANAMLADFLTCDAVKRGVYCYTHNRIT